MSFVTAKAQYNYNWSLGGTMGMGVTGYSEGYTFAMSLTIGFNQVINDTKWRWGIDAGIINQGIMDYLFDEYDEDFYIRPNFEYLAGVLDYSILSKGSIDVFARAAIAPAHQRDLFLYHSEHHFTVLGIAGIGADIGFNRFSITGYLSNKGIPSLLFSYGWYFGGKAKAKPNLNQDK